MTADFLDSHITPRGGLMHALYNEPELPKVIVGWLQSVPKED